jgi:mRNA interferase MazF
MGMVKMKQYSICLANLDPTVGHEIKKTRPCVVISPNEMNEFLSTIIIAPMTTKSHNYPTRIKINFQNKSGWIVLDQIRAIDKARLVKTLGKLDIDKIKDLKDMINEMLVR